LNDLINDMIKLHKLESVGGGFAVDVATSLLAVRDDLRSFYADADKQLVLEAEEIRVHILPEHLQSVLTNLIDNAVQYSEGETVTARMQRSGAGVKISVDDQGPLIAENERKRIFERFYTCSRSRNKRHSGTGLGLSIVKHIASLYDGSVQVEPNGEGGNCFVVMLQEKES
jgi:two-component system phosphate regulon sensor histidine kinase PhoR